MTVDNVKYKPSSVNGDKSFWTGSCSMLCNRKKKDVIVDVTTSGIHLYCSQKKLSLFYQYEHVASCLIIPEEQFSKSELCLNRFKQQSIADSNVCIRLTVYKEANSSKFKRKEITLILNAHNNYDDNFNDATLLQTKITSFINAGYNNMPILFILNPQSGKGKAVKIFEQKIKPMLDDFARDYQILITKYSNHAFEFIQNHMALPDTFSAVVTVSGDGLLYEVLNGFVDSVEKPEDLKIPVPLGIIPGGSGNGLAHTINCSFLNGNKSVDEVTDCTMHVIQGKPTEMDIIRIVSPDKTYYSFLSFGWGLMADIDIESERLRWLGESRFTLWSLFRGFFPKKYRGTLSYLHIDKPCDAVPLSSPLTEDWVSVTGTFVQVYAGYQKYLNSTLKFAPDSTLDDQTIYLTYIQANVSAFQIIQFLIALEDGSHTKLPFVTYLPVKAFRLEPDSKDDILTVDGELLASTVVQAEIMPKKATILMRS